MAPPIYQQWRHLTPTPPLTLPNQVLTSDRRSPALTLKNLPPGDYEFGLSVTSSHTAGNARGFKWKVYKTARANAFRLTVFPEAAILLTLPCPAQVRVGCVWGGVRGRE